MKTTTAWMLRRRGYSIRVMNDANQARSLLNSLQRIWPEERWQLLPFHPSYTLLPWPLSIWLRQENHNQEGR